MKNNIVLQKAENFALEIISLCNSIKEQKSEYIMSNQLFRSATSIGANIAESVYASSSADFINKLQIALKEASETEYWLRLLYKSNYIALASHTNYDAKIKEIIKLLTSSINTAKTNLNIGAPQP